MDIEKKYEKLFSCVPDSDAYFLLSIKQNEFKDRYAAFYSLWLKKIDDRFEQRRISTISPEHAIKFFFSQNQKIAIINEKSDLNLVLNIGGHALVREDVMRKHFSEILEPIKVVNSLSKGYVDYNMIDNRHKKRYAIGALRMEIFNRDQHQCRICGSSPDDNVHVRLEVHHIKPWNEGGISEPENLILLCKICHDGINIVDRNILYKKIGINFPNTKHNLYFPSNSIGFNNIVDNSVTIKLNNKIKVR